jgi:molecular chaperone Hsp33
LEALDEAAAGAITEVEETKLLETRNFRFHCGCDLERILPILGNWRNRLDELFHGEPEITIQCPRCAASYRVSREQVVAS